MSVQATVQFLEHLAQGDPVTFQTFDDGKSRRKHLSSVKHGSLDKHLNCLEDLNQKGAGIFVMVNAGDLVGRTTLNVERVRAVFVDLDGAPLEASVSGALAA